MHDSDVGLRLARLGLVSFGIFFVMGFTDVRLIAHVRTVVLADSSTSIHLEMVIAILPGSFPFTAVHSCRQLCIKTNADT